MAAGNAASHRNRARIDFAGRSLPILGAGGSWQSRRGVRVPGFCCPGAAVRGVPEPPRRALQPSPLRLLRPPPRREPARRRRPLSATVVRRNRSRPPSHHHGRRQAPPDRARRSSLSLWHGLNARSGNCLVVALQCEMLARRVSGVAVRGGPAPAAIGLTRCSPTRRIFFSDSLGCGKVIGVRSIVALFAALLGVGVLAAPPSFAGPTVCDYPACTPGIMGHQVLGTPCDNTTYYAFGTDSILTFSRSRAADVLRLAAEIRAAMVPVTSDGGRQGRGRRLPPVSELRRAGARWPVPDLHSP